MIDFIEPNWQMPDFHKLNYVISPHKDPDLVEIYVASGHARSQMLIGNYYEPNPMPYGVYRIKELWSQHLDNTAIGINYFQSGWYLPMHYDPYTAYNRNFNSAQRSIVRAIVMLEDSAPGQIIQIGSRACGDWRAGQVFMWRDREPHAFYNLSTRPRYAVQVTGLVKQQS